MTEVTSVAPPLEPLEIAAGHVFGVRRDGQLPDVPSGMSARAALERAVLGALRRPPCLVSFSGGRDSSAVLAVAQLVARREGLPEPVPVSLRFPDAPLAQETDWQELVIRHLGIDDWPRIEIHDELDLVGPIATAALRRHGLLWPCNLHVHVPMLDLARGGSLLTGIEGDGLFGAWRWEQLVSALVGRRKLVAGHARMAALAVAPAALRRAWLRRPQFDSRPWLQPAAKQVVRARLAEYYAAEPVRWDRRVAWWARSRYLDVFQSGMSLLAADRDVALSHPVLDPLFLAALARDGGTRGVGDRTRLMQHLVGDLLPEAVVSRRTKVIIDQAAWGPHARRFAAEWDGTGADHGLVDVDRLRATWLADQPFASAATLLQAAWLATSAHRGGE